MNKRKLIIIISIIVIALATTAGALFLFKGKDKQPQEESENHNKVFNYYETDLLATNEYYKTELKCTKATLNEDIAYSLDYGADLPCENGAELSRKKAVSGIVAAGLRYGYPNVSAEELGAESDEEARMATQFAVWRLAQATGVEESIKTESIFDMDNLKSADGYEERLKRIKLIAQNIVDEALGDPYYANPTLNIVSKDSKISIINDEEMKIGPFKIDGFGLEVTNLKVSLLNPPESYVFCDADGNEKTEFKTQEDIYIRLPQNTGAVTCTLRVDIEGYHNAGVMYGTEDDSDNKQNFCVLETYEDKLTAEMDLSIPELTGGIEVTVLDNYDAPLAGLNVRLKDEAGNELNILETDENGKVMFDKLIVGTYFVTLIEELNGYIMPDIPIESTVCYNEINNLTFENVLIEGGLKVISVDDTQEKYLAGIIYEVLDEDKNPIATIVSDENGVAIADKLTKGVYYFREISGPANIGIDSTEHKFEIEEHNVIEVYTVMHYYAQGKIRFTVTDESNKPLEGVKIQILDEEYNVVDTILTDKDGKASSAWLLLGNYYYRQNDVPDGIVIDTTVYEFKLTKHWQVIEEEVECEIER